MFNCLKYLNIIDILVVIVSFMFYEFELYEYITFCCLFIVINKKGYLFGIILVFSYFVQIAIIWDLKRQIFELRNFPKEENKCSTFKVYYFEREIKFC